MFIGYLFVLLQQLCIDIPSEEILLTISFLVCTFFLPPSRCNLGKTKEVYLSFMNLIFSL